jgi:hypothetical protein
VLICGWRPGPPLKIRASLAVTDPLTAAGPLETPGPFAILDPLATFDPLTVPGVGVCGLLMLRPAWALLEKL